MEKEGIPQPLVSQPATASAPPMPLGGEATPYYRGPPQEPHSVDHMTAASAPPPYHMVDQTQQQAMHGYNAPLLHHPTPGYQAQGYPASTYPMGYVQQPQPNQASNVVVVTQQPVAPPQFVQTQRDDTAPITGLIFSILMTFLCLLCGNVLALSCFIPAMVVAFIGIASNDNVKRKKFGNASIIISAVSTTLWVILFVAIPIITGVAVAVSASSSRR